MSGCFGTSPVDRWMESNLDRYLEENPSWEAAEDEYGSHLGKHPNYGEVFETGVGTPVLVDDVDVDTGAIQKVLMGMQDAKTYKTKDGGYLVILGSYRFKGNRSVFRREEVFKLEVTNG